MTTTLNRVMMADSYKYSHAISQYPKNTVNQFDYFEARSTKVYDSTLFYGLQAILKTYFSTPITLDEIIEATEYSIFHGIPFNLDGWMRIFNKYDGFLPVTIKAVQEGTLVPNKNVLFTVELTENDENVFWIVSWLETFLMKVWYTNNIATRSFYVKKLLLAYANKTQDNPFVDYQYHNFGDRGSSSVESATIGGAAHLTSFMGTDNFGSIKFIADNFGDAKETIGHSIPATEHSTVTSWGKENEMKMVMNFIESNKGKPIIACVADSYDVFKFVDTVTSNVFKEKIESDEYPVFVIRPDSGNPAEIVNYILDTFETNNVQFIINEKGYKVLNKYRIIWGDGIDDESIKTMLDILVQRNYSSENISFGSGGWLMQKHDRDTMGCAIKCSEITYIEEGERKTRDVFKDPITDPGKKSKKGKVTLALNRNGAFRTIPVKDLEKNVGFDEILRPIYVNGEFKNFLSFEEIRHNVQASLKREGF